MNKKNKILAMYAMAAAMSGQYDRMGFPEERISTPKVKKVKPLPPGLKLFYFDENGQELPEGDPNILVSVKAINLKNAQRKALKLLI